MADLTLKLIHSAPNYLCYGFVLYNHQRPILGWTADSRFDKKIYDTVAAAPTAIVHGRDAPSGDHASFDETNHYANIHLDTHFYVSHFEQTNYSFTTANVTLLETGKEFAIDEAL